LSGAAVFVPGLDGYQFSWIASGERAATFDPSVWTS
jgi:hypothetical protein